MKKCIVWSAVLFVVPFFVRGGLLYGNEFCKLAAIPGCTGAKIFQNPAWTELADAAKRDPVRFEFLIGRFSASSKTAIHICNWENASQGVLAVMVVEKVTGRSWLDYDGKHADVKRAIRQAKITFPAYAALTGILADPASCRELQNFFLRMYYGTNKNALPPEQLIAIAEKELVRVYGQKVLEQRPWNIISENDYTVVLAGTFNYPAGRCGGVARIMLRKHDGTVLHLIHGK